MAFVAALFVAAGLAAIAWGLAERSRNRQRVLAELLDAELSDTDASPRALADLVERTGAFAERALARTPWNDRLRRMLARAGWSLRAGEFLAVCAAIAGGSIAFAVLLTGSVWRGIALGAFAPVAVVTVVRIRGERRVSAVEAQLPTTLQLLAGSLSSGASILHAMELVAAEGDPPLSEEFARVVAETTVGRPLTDALVSMAARVGSRDLDWTVEAIRIQHRTGGKLADTLRVLAGFMRTRLEVRGEVRALSAEARLSGKVLTALPFVLAGWLLFTSPDYLEPLFTTPLGHMMLVIAASGLVAGIWLMRRIVRVEV